MNMLGFDELTSLNELLKSGSEPQDDILDQINEKNINNTMNPGNIGPKLCDNSSSAPGSQKPKNPSDIWDLEELNSKSDYTDIYDPRAEPQYEIYFKQNIDTSDVYLQLSNKTPSSASCESMVVRIQLPDTKYSQITLDVQESFLDLRTPIYKLGLHLPNPVDPDSGTAKWNGDKFELIVTLSNRRDLDFMNF